jgi:hypothetical protein
MDFEFGKRLRLEILQGGEASAIKKDEVGKAQPFRTVRRRSRKRESVEWTKTLANWSPRSIEN